MIARIQSLDPLLANQIAAGEVVERPASVVKELLENSLDAGAQHIEVLIDKGGQQRIMIRDDGHGIVREDLALALARHATSKIATLDDLEHIRSLGFRGEALASISAVSRLTLTSRPEQQADAWQITVEGPLQQESLHPAAHPKGTTVEVCDLFFNTPARRRFLRSPKTESSYIEENIKQIALSHHDVSFLLKQDGKLVCRYLAQSAEDGLALRVSAVLGKTFVQHAAPLEAILSDVQIKGFLGLPSFHRSQSNGQYLFVNGRAVRDKVLNHAIRQAYVAYLPEGRLPVFVLYITLPVEHVDVNVHPTKSEVRFQESRLVHDFIVQSISKTLAEYSPATSLIAAASATTLPGVREEKAPSYQPRSWQPSYAQFYQPLRKESSSEPIMADVPQHLHVQRLSERFLLIFEQARMFLLDVSHEAYLQYLARTGDAQPLPTASMNEWYAWWSRCRDLSKPECWCELTDEDWASLLGSHHE